jgi:flagellin-like hook-associated protein FlgL
MYSGISLSSGIRSNLFSLNQTNFLLQKSQNRLATGLKVSSPLDNPASFFQASNLNQRALDLTRVLDNTAKATGVLTTAQNGLASINSLLQQAKGYAQSALGASSSTSGTPPTLTAGITDSVSPYRALQQLSNSNSVVGLADGGTINVWTSQGEDGSGYGVIGQRHAADGTKQGPGFKINENALGNQYKESITEVSGGGFIVTWYDDSVGGGFIGRRFDAYGRAITGEFVINETSANTIQNGVVTQLADGNFVAVYSINGQDGSSSGIYARKFNASGVALGTEFRVNTYTTNAQTDPDVAALKDGGFVVTWDSDGQDGQYKGVYAQRYDNTGAAAGSEFQVNQATSGFQTRSSVTTLNNGNFIVTWTDDDDNSVKIRHYSSSGVALSGDTTVKAGTVSNRAQFSTIQSLNDGGFVVAYATSDGLGIYAQRYNSAIQPIENEILVGSTVVPFTNSPSLGKLSNGGFVVNYDSYDNDSTGVFTRRYDGETTSGIPDLVARADYADLFNETFAQINAIALDSGYDGINLLKNQNFKVNFNENGTSSLNLQGGLYDTSGLGLLSSLTSGSWATDTEINTSITALDNAISLVSQGVSKYTSNQNIVNIRKDFTDKIILTLQDNVEKLTVADTNEESAKILALQTRQQLSLAALSIMAQSEQNTLNFLQSITSIGSNGRGQ